MTVSTLKSTANELTKQSRPKGLGTASIPRPRPVCGAEDFSTFTLQELAARWRKEFRKPAPSLQKFLLAQLLAYKLRARTEGELNSETIRYLHKIALEDRRRREAGEKKPKEVPPIPLPKRRQGLKPGSLIIREYNGVVHRIKVIEDGFEWNENTYSSLSPIACAITGTRCNGPKFFGLRQGTATTSTRKALS
jgi:Protein of unknown function (DUF2924)